MTTLFGSTISDSEHLSYQWIKGNKCKKTRSRTELASMPSAPGDLEQRTFGLGRHRIIPIDISNLIFAPWYQIIVQANR